MEWFVQLMVMKRASFFPSHRDAYLKFLEETNSKPLYEEVILTTCESCKVLLLSPTREPIEESLLTVIKSLGNWVRKLTIARNRELLDTELDLKYLIIKILEPCRNNHTFQLPNAWVMGILSLLNEIYLMPCLQISLLSSIEVWWVCLKYMGPVQPTKLLANLSKKKDGNPDFLDKDPCITPEAHDQHLSTAMDKIKDIVFINTRLLHPRLSGHSRDLKLAVWKAIEIVVPDLVKTSVNVALQSTRAHIFMGYPLGTPESLIEDAASIMVTSLAQKYAKKMCKEPLLGWMYSLLHGSLQHPWIQYETRCRIVDSIITDNLEPICGGIQQMATAEVVRVFRSWISLRNDENSIKVVKESLKAGISLSEMKDLLDSLFGSSGKNMKLCWRLFSVGWRKALQRFLRRRRVI